MRISAVLRLAVSILVGATFVSNAGLRAQREPVPPRPVQIVSSDDPEAQLSQVLDNIERNRLDIALERTQALIHRYPNFRLAHLIHGDLLVARTRPLNGFGDAPGAPADRIAELRDEAVARLKAYRDRPPANFLPRYLLKMRPDQKYAVVVDTGKSRLYVYQNASNGDNPRLIADYYISHGKEGAQKFREGDKKTPLGVYYVVASIPATKLTDFYGTGAYPINYPNEWDRLQGRAGHGIWLHGVPSTTLSRPPKASDGCVVLANRDLDAVASRLQLGLTPVIISAKVEWYNSDDVRFARNALQQEIETWRHDWESGDVNRYLRHYARDFKSDNATRAQWAERKLQVARGKQWQVIRIDKLSMFASPGEDMVVVSFEQDYRSNNLQQVAQKRQYWIKEDGQWKIVYEGTA